MSNSSVIVGRGGECALGEYATANESLIEFELTSMEDTGLQHWLTSASRISNKVIGINLSHTMLSQSSLMKLLAIILQDRMFRSLSQLDIAYCDIPEMAVNMLCEYLNPFSGGYNISVLNATRCKLGYHGTSKILESIYANNTLKVLLLTGNSCTDKALSFLHTALIKYLNQIETIGLGSNRITDTGLLMLCSVLELPNRPLKCLLLENNPDIGNAKLDDFFIALNKGSAVDTLSLAGCNIVSCEWSRYLPFMGCLHTLDLSYNLIDDDEFGKLCKALETCYCLRHLDLAFNRFCGTNCNVIEQMLAANGALQSLSLKGNRCVDSVWAALHRGMLLNKSLLDLNLSDCNITMHNAREICRLYECNDICTIDFSNNPLPAEFISSTREQTLNYYALSTNKTKQQLNSGGVASGAVVLPLNPQAHVLSIARTEEWRAVRAREVALSLNSLCIVADRQHLLVPAADQHSAALTSGALPATITGGTDTTKGDDIAIGAPSSQALTSPGTIALSELYLSPEALREHIAESDLANTAERRVMHVAYGRPALVIGHIDITSLTTFAEAQLLVHPLVEEYVSTIAANPEVHRDLVSKYSLMDPAGLTPAKADAQLRRVWPEFCTQAEPVLVVRPGNWVRL